MAETVVYDGVGTTIAFATTGVSFGVEKITLPGWARAAIDMTKLSNTSVKTKKAAKLKDYADFSVTVELNPTHAFSSTFASNEQITITFPDSLGTLVVWGFVSDMKPGDVSMDAKSTFDLTITVSNLNDSGVETAPSFS